jgi:hypothetical protein
MTSFVEFEGNGLTAYIPYRSFYLILAEEETAGLRTYGAMILYVDDDRYAVVERVARFSIFLLGIAWLYLIGRGRESIGDKTLRCWFYEYCSIVFAILRPATP